MKKVVNAVLAKCILCYFGCFTIKIGGIGAYFVYIYWYLKSIHHMLTLILTKKQRFTECNSIEHINGKN